MLISIDLPSVVWTGAKVRFCNNPVPYLSEPCTGVSSLPCNIDPCNGQYSRPRLAFDPVRVPVVALDGELFCVR